MRKKCNAGKSPHGNWNEKLNNERNTKKENYFLFAQRFGKTYHSLLFDWEIKTKTLHCCLFFSNEFHLIFSVYIKLLTFTVCVLCMVFLFSHLFSFFICMFVCRQVVVYQWSSFPMKSTNVWRFARIY